MRLLKATPALLITVLVTLISCKKKQENGSEPIPFSFSAPDELVFEHSDTKTLNVLVLGDSNFDFGVGLSELNNAFFAGFSQQTTIGGYQTAVFNVPFNQHNAEPGNYPAKLTVSVANQNAASQSKTIQLVYAPNCAYAFRNHQNGEITFQINGILENRTISCIYNNQGQLVVTGLTTYTVVLNLNCDDQSVTMQPTFNIGSNMTASGQIEGNEIVLQMYSDGNYHALARIKP